MEPFPAASWTRLPRRALLAGLGLALAALAGCGGSRDNPMLPELRAWRPWHSRVETVNYAPFRGGRPLWIYTPPGAATPDHPRHVLFVLDGNSAFGGAGTFRLQRVADSLLALHAIEPVIIVGIAAGPFDLRAWEYLPDLGGEAFYAGIRDTLLPFVRARYGPDVTPDCGILGASYGGVAAAWAAFRDDSTFTRAAALSPTYFAGGYLPALMRTRGRGGVQRFYQDTGTVDDNRFGPLLYVATIAESLGFVDGCDLVTRQIAGGNHTADSWALRMPDILRFLFAPADSLPCAAGPAGRGWTASAALSSPR